MEPSACVLGSSWAVFVQNIRAVARLLGDSSIDASWATNGDIICVFNAAWDAHQRCGVDRVVAAEALGILLNPPEGVFPAAAMRACTDFRYTDGSRHTELWTAGDVWAQLVVLLARYAGGSTDELDAAEALLETHGTPGNTSWQMQCGRHVSASGCSSAAHAPRAFAFP